MAASKRSDVLTALLARLAVITEANGYNTDAGKVVFLGVVPALGPDDPAYAIAVIVGDDDAPRWQGEHVFYRLPIEIHILAQISEEAPDEAWVVVEAALQDVKRAVEQADRSLGRLLSSELVRGQTRTLMREAGSLVTGAAITYLAPIAEQWGNP